MALARRLLRLFPAPRGTSAAGPGPVGPPRARMAVALLLPTLSLVIGHLFFTPHYFSDDEAVQMLASGQGIAVRPTPYVLFMHPLVGHLLVALYSALPAIPWYRVLILAVQWATGAVTAHAVLSAGLTRPRVALLAAYFLITDLSVVVYAQFTITAAAAALAAVAVWLGRAAREGWTPGRAALFLGLFVLAGMLRHDAARMGLVVAAPLVLAVWLAGLPGAGPGPLRDRLRVGVRRHALPFAAALALAEAANAAHGWYYQRTPGWAEYWARRAAFAEFLDYNRVPYTPETASRYAQVGWTQNDYYLLLSYFFADRDVFTLSKFQQILAESPPHERSFTVSWVRLEMLSLHGLPWHAFAVSLLPLAFLGRDRRAWLGYLAVLGAVAVLAVVLFGFWHRLPARVFVPFTMFTAVVGAALADHEGGRRRYTLAAAAAALVAASGYARMYRDSVAHVATCRQVEASLTALRPQPDRLFVNWGLAFPWRYTVRPCGSPPEFQNLRVFSIGAAANTPITDAVLAEFGITDWLTAVTTRDDILFICHPASAELLRTFLREHRGVAARVEPVDLPGVDRDLVPLYRFRRVPPTDR